MKFLEVLLIVSTFCVCCQHYNQPEHKVEYEHYLAYKDKVYKCSLPKEELILFKIVSKQDYLRYKKIRPKNFTLEQQRLLNKFKLFSYETNLSPTQTRSPN